MKTIDQHLIKINLPGGVISAGDLYEILVIAKKAGSEHVRFGNRQQLYFTIDTTQLEDLEFDMLSAGIDHEVDTDSYPNIVSSYAADTVFSNESWLKEGVYKDVFDLFNFKPLLKINLLDSSQTFVPFFTGNLNFISSDVSNYWHLYVRYPKTNILYCWPSLIYSDDIPAVCKKVEEVIFSAKDKFYDQPEIDSSLLYELVMHESDFVIQQSIQALKIPEFHLPYYEGINRHGNKYWLGVYRRDELFPVDFLMDCCTLCMQTRVGQLYLTPWKSILIKGIELADRGLWVMILNKYRVNVRHAANELNWQIEDICDFCLDLKKRLVRDFEEADLRTSRLCFAIKKQPKTGLFGSIIIRKQEELFEIIHTRDFNPNSKDFVVYKQNLKAHELSEHLIALCNYFYNLRSFIAEYQISANSGAEESSGPVNSITVYQCKNCFSIYDETYGDSANNISPGTDFNSLDQYCCPTCDAPKEDFVEIEKQIIA